jgi:Ca2+-binding EF-hand superfamily protein
MLMAGAALAASASMASAQSKQEIQAMDRNGDGRVSRAEWTAPAGAFRLHDTNKDGVLSGTEVWSPNDPRLSGHRDLAYGRNDDRVRFRQIDRNNDGFISRTEWPDSAATFRALDENRDGRIGRNEYRSAVVIDRDNRDNPVTRSEAFRAGYERGLTEGRAAGREDRDRNQGFDLEGQRELTFADSGYDARFGDKTEYQAGYREAFRLAYREGWERR